MHITRINGSAAFPSSGYVPEPGQPDRREPRDEIQSAKNKLGSLVILDRVEQIRAFLEQIHSDWLLKGLMQGHTPLHMAASRKNAQTMTALLEYLPAAVNAVNAKGNTPLIVAAKNGHAEVIRVLLTANAYPEVKDRQGWTALCWATFSGAVDAMKALAGFEASSSVAPAVIRADIEASDNDGNTPVMVAIQNGHFEAAKLLIEMGANVNATNHHGTTPAMLAAAGGDVTVLELLAQYGADLNQKDKLGHSALIYATCTSKGEFDEKAARSTVAALIRLGADIETKNRDGYTPLMIAFDRDKATLDGAKILIDAHANINAQREGGQTVLMLAGEKRNRAAVALLIERKVNLNAQDDRGRVALSHACRAYDCVFAEQLLRAGASKSVTDNDGVLPYTRAPMGSDTKMADLFSRYK